MGGAVVALVELKMWVVTPLNMTWKWDKCFWTIRYTEDDHCEICGITLLLSAKASLAPHEASLADFKLQGNRKDRLIGCWCCILRCERGFCVTLRDPERLNSITFTIPRGISLDLCEHGLSCQPQPVALDAAAGKLRVAKGKSRKPCDYGTWGCWDATGRAENREPIRADCP